jgi:hypothetical protein
MINQKIIFANSGKVVKEIDFGLIKDSIAGFKTADSSKKPITVWAHSFRQFNELKIYAIYASANCNGVKCPEYFSFFLENGECIFSGTTSDSSFAEKMKHSMDEYGIGELELDSLFESAIRVDYFYQ